MHERRHVNFTISKYLFIFIQCTDYFVFMIKLVEFLGVFMIKSVRVRC